MMIRHYVDNEGVYLHASDLEASLRATGAKLPDGDYRRALQAVADAIYGHAAKVEQRSMSSTFMEEVKRILG